MYFRLEKTRILSRTVVVYRRFSGDLIGRPYIASFWEGKRLNLGS